MPQIYCIFLQIVNTVYNINISSLLSNSLTVCPLTFTYLVTFHFSGCSISRCRNSPILLPRAARSGWQLSNVSRGGWKVSQTHCRLRYACDEGNEGQDQLWPDQEGPRGSYGVLARQPPTRLPYLWPGWRVWFAGSVHGLWIRQKPFHRHPFLWKKVSAAVYFVYSR